MATKGIPEVNSTSDDLPPTQKVTMEAAELNSFLDGDIGMDDIPELSDAFESALAANTGDRFVVIYVNPVEESDEDETIAESNEADEEEDEEDESDD